MKNKLLLFLFFFCIILILQEGATGQSINTSFSTLLYFTPLWIFFIEFTLYEIKFRKSEMGGHLIKLIIFYLIVFVLQTLFLLLIKPGGYAGPFIWNSVRLFTPLLSILLISSFIIPTVGNAWQDSSVNLIFFSSGIALIPKLLSSSFSSFDILKVISLGVSPLESDTLCFVFGLIAAHYILKGKKWLILLSLIMVFLTGKRIVFLGLLIFYILNLRVIRERVERKTNMFGIMLLLINSFYCYFLYDLGSGEGKIIDFLENLFSKTTEELTVGRLVLYERIIAQMGFPSMFGNGMGNVMFSLRKISSAEEWLHSDILMNFYEVGIIGCIIWMIYLFNLFKSNYTCLTFLVMFNVFMLTDNAFYYFVPSFLLYFLMWLNSINNDIIHDKKT